MFGRHGLQTPARRRARVVILRPRHPGSGLTRRLTVIQTRSSIKTHGCARLTSETSRVIKIFVREAMLRPIAIETSRLIGQETSTLIVIEMRPNFVLVTTWRTIATGTLRLIGQETSSLIATAVLPSFVLATIWQSIATETSRIIVGAMLRSTITSAAPRLAVNSMRPSAITTESGTIVVGGEVITIGSSL